MMGAVNGDWISITEAIALVALRALCDDEDARRRLLSRFLDREFRLAADRVVSQLPTGEYLADVALGDIAPINFPPMERTVDERLQLTPLMFPPGALDADSPIWTGEASFPVAHEGPLARVSYYGLRMRQSDLDRLFPAGALTGRATSETSAVDWIRDHEGRNVNKAYRAYKRSEPGGVKRDAFREDWKKVHSRGPGRPGE